MIAPVAPLDPAAPEEALLDAVQRQTLRYFWDFAHPTSGLARERSNGMLNAVTTGGTGFGLMAILCGIERGWIERSEGLDRLTAMVQFLAGADRHHGAFPHWLDGITGRTKPFGAMDDGGDLVETAFLMAGLLAVRQYFRERRKKETALRQLINRLWHEVEWDWYARDGDVLYWHWSPVHGWAMNHPIQGWNECLITYVLAAASPTHPIAADVYHRCFASGPVFLNGRSYDGMTLPLGPDFGGPLFFAHYSFLGLDPRRLADRYADYWQQNRAHTLINRAYCIANPKGFAGYGVDCWGLTASDSIDGYVGHSPTDDRGVVTPSAALSSYPYTPQESLAALRYFAALGEPLWGEYGFRDAFSLSAGWYAPSYLAIDEGPIVTMIENHRSGLLWRVLMSCREVKRGLAALGFSRRTGAIPVA